MNRLAPISTLFPYTTLFRSILELVDRDRAFGLEPDVEDDGGVGHAQHLRFDDLAFLDIRERPLVQQGHFLDLVDRKSTRLNSSHSSISYAVFCLKKKKHTVL